jgi:Ca-activated chloride channel homolog
MEIISEVQKHQNARVFAFGIGSAVNRFLLDKIAEAGRGEVEYVSLSDDGSAAAKKFHERVRSPLLTDISIDWNGMPVTDVYPQRIPDLFSAKPLILSGRFTAPANGTIHLRGKVAGNDFARDIQVSFPETMAAHDVLSSLWARRRIDDLMSNDYGGAQNGNMKPELKQTITQVGLEYRLMTQFTSFVAVEEMVVTDGGQPRRIDVPVEVPEGVNQSMVDPDAADARSVQSAQTYGFSINSAAMPRRARGGGAGIGRGSGKGVGNGAGNLDGGTMPKPQASPANAPPMVAGIAVENDAAVLVVSPEEQRLNTLRSKLHPGVLAVVIRLRDKQTSPTTDEQRFVRDGKAEVQIWMTEKSAEAMTKLKELGFEVVLDQKNSSLIIGRLAIDKLEALADLKFVRYVSPQVSR